MDATRTTLDLIEGLLREKDAPHYVLLNPGPTLTSPRVKSALVHHDVCHRDPEFSDVVLRLQSKLRKVFGGSDRHAVLILSGSGTAAMEASISSTVPEGKKLLVVDNGAFGARLKEIADLHGIPVVHLRYEYGQLPSPADVDAALAADPEIFAVAMIHHETSVGLLNPVREVGELCHRHGRLFIVDAVSSLAGEDIDVTRDHIDLCFSSSNKCLHGFAGVSFVCVAERVWARIADVKPRVYYLDLKRYRRYADELAQTPFTPAVSNFLALDAALDELLAAGVERRWAVYRERNKKIRATLRSLGMGFYTSTGRESRTITTVEVPKHMSFATLYDALKARGYLVYDAKEPMRGRYFQIANMGEISDEDIEGFLEALTDVVTAAKAARRGRRGGLRLVSSRDVV